MNTGHPHGHPYTDERDRADAAEAPAARLTGTVVRLMRDKGFGFIRLDNSAAEFFVHMTNCMGDTWHLLDIGSAVTFMATMTEKGQRAIQVKLLER